eukprot:5238946-Heterocapsa_arctica.AAC.1
MPFKTPTRICGTLPNIDRLARVCSCTLPHEHLSGLAVMPEPGGSTRAVWKTALAASYPPALCRAVVDVATASAPRGGWRRVGEPSVAP